MQLAGNPAPLLGDGLHRQRFPRPFELVDQGLLTPQNPSEGERENGRRRPRSPRDPFVGHQPLRQREWHERGRDRDQYRPRQRSEVRRDVQHHDHAEEERHLQVSGAANRHRERHED
jgi:hypothetical protein